VDSISQNLKPLTLTTSTWNGRPIIPVTFTCTIDNYRTRLRIAGQSISSPSSSSKSLLQSCIRVLASLSSHCPGAPIIAPARQPCTNSSCVCADNLRAPPSKSLNCSLLPCRLSCMMRSTNLVSRMEGALVCRLGSL